VPKEKVDSYVELAEKLELKIEAVDIAANCVARVFANSVKNGKEFRSIGIIDIGTKSSSIVVMDKGKLFMEREVHFGIENLTREISRRLQTDMDEALKYLLNYFNFDGMNEEHEVDRRIQELFDNVSASFLKVVQFYTTGKVQKNLDEIFVIGGGSQIKGIENYLSRYLGSPVYTVDTPEKISRKIHLPQDDMLKFHINTLGLLLRKE
jgi:type IV pilus assembly protein PilM